MPEPDPERRPATLEPQLLIAIGVGIVVLLILLVRAPEFDGVFAERPDFTINRPPATQFPSVTPGASPTFGPTSTPRPPSATPTFGPDAVARDELRRGHLTRIGELLEEYFEDNGTYPRTGSNIQSLCVYTELDVGCALRDYAPDGVLPGNPEGDPYQYLSEDGTTWVLFARLEGNVSEAERCAHSSAANVQDREHLICPSGGAP